MDWNGAIEINKTALVRIIAGLVALLGAQGAVSRLPLPVYRTILRVLRPAESAVRRLIVIAARGLVLPAGPSMPRAIVFSGKRAKGSRCMSFRLFDKRRGFVDFAYIEEMPAAAPVTTGPRIRIIEPLSPREQFLAKFAKPKENDNTASENASMRLVRRLEAVKQALENLPYQARRMARWKARRKAMENAPFLSPLKPGRAPGHVKRSKDELQLVLQELQSLARWALQQDTS